MSVEYISQTEYHVKFLVPKMCVFFVTRLVVLCRRLLTRRTAVLREVVIEILASSLSLLNTGC